MTNKTPSPPRDARHLSPEGRGTRNRKVMRAEHASGVRLARKLRREETEAEARLWYELRNRRLAGYKFYRQVPIGSYVVDFFCKSEYLVVEADGSHHANNDRDLARTKWLNNSGFSVLRFWNHEIFEHRNMVLENIYAALNGNLEAGGCSNGFWPRSSSPSGERCQAKRGGEGE